MLSGACVSAHTHENERVSLKRDALRGVCFRSAPKEPLVFILLLLLLDDLLSSLGCCLLLHTIELFLKEQLSTYCKKIRFK